MYKSNEKFHTNIILKCQVLLSFTHIWLRLFWGEIFEVEILMELHVLKSSETENPVLSIWTLYMSVRLLSAQLKNK